jgi:hypothetical protein
MLYSYVGHFPYFVSSITSGTATASLPVAPYSDDDAHGEVVEYRTGENKHWGKRGQPTTQAHMNESRVETGLSR